MAATEPEASPDGSTDPAAATEPGDLAPANAGLSADVAAPRAPRVGHRALIGIVLVLVVVLVAALVVHLVLVRQPHLTPVPIPSVSRI